VVLRPGAGREVNELLVLRNEPLSRGGGKPHMAEFVSPDTGGERLYVSSQFRSGLTEDRYRKLNRAHSGSGPLELADHVRQSGSAGEGSRAASGSQDDHASQWHRVLPNTERSASGTHRCASWTEL
jgi:hypothetical protein